MYTTCMFCHKPLGTNEVVESFPVGRRLAFDAARGRLWVVCTRCERWNLTPLEERWEAVEDCERLFRDTRIRVSTDNIGLARHPEGLTLVRIGQPRRPEFAAWRYGDQFGRRRRRAVLYGAAGIAVVGGIVVGGVAAGLSAGVISQVPNWFNIWNSRRTLVKLHPAAGGVLKLNQQDLLGTRVRPSDDEQGFRLQVRRKKTKTWYEGVEARRFAGAILPRMNRTGGSRDAVQDAVHLIETTGHPELFLARIAEGQRFQDKKGVPGYVNKMPRRHKLALEMALHEEQERRALEGELWLLERAWEEAEEIADISDKLFLPEGAEEFLQENRPGPSGSAGGVGERREDDRGGHESRS